MILYRIRPQAIGIGSVSEYDEDTSLHLPGAMPGHLTLCGWVDVQYDRVEGKKTTCSTCCAIVRAVHQIPLSALGVK